ncbi:GGDEF domain-containing response regulator [Calditrichota bacterium LG25]
MNKNKIKILYIEDDPDARALMSDILRYQGYAYYEASRGLEGIRLAKKHKPDLIIIDLMLPDMQGSEVTTHLKSQPDLKSIPIIALTAAEEEDIREYVLAAGCDGYISKPININEFVFKIEEFLAGKRESVSPEFERELLQRYNINLVERLKRKVSELEQLNKNLTKLNQDLIASREELARYNDLLFYLNALANELRSLEDPQKMLRILPAKIVEGFAIDRCIVFRYDSDESVLSPFSLHGNFNADSENLNFKMGRDLLALLKEERGLLWVKDVHQIKNPLLKKIADTLNSVSFVVGYLKEFGRKDISDSFVIEGETEELDAIFDIDERFLIYFDKCQANQKFATYEIRILRSFLHTVAVIFENMLLFNQLKKLYKIKSEEAIRDGLTNVYNYRYFVRELRKEVARTKRYKTPFSLIMLDIDFFKTYNDLHGHLEGDEVLRAISRLLILNTRSTDIVARYGGEEFVIILPGIKKKEAVTFAEKLRRLIKDYQFPDKVHIVPCSLTISLGVASCPEDSDDPVDLVRLADQALYRAKQQGRDQVCVV